MVDQKKREQPPQIRDRGRPSWVAVLLGTLVVAVIGIGIWAVVAANQADDLEVATGLADDWLAAWNGTDAEVVAALYSEDGVHVPPAAWDMDTAVGRDAVRAHAATYLREVSGSMRTDDLNPTESGRAFTFPIAFQAGGTSWVADIRIELDDDRASRVEFLTVTDTALQRATSYADMWLAAWSGTDPQAIAALYTADGVHVAPAWQLPEAVGHDAILAHARRYASEITDARRTGEVVSAGAGMNYRFPIQFMADGVTWNGEVEIALDGELASRVELVTADVAG